MRTKAWAAGLAAALLALTPTVAFCDPAQEGDVVVANHAASVEFKIVAAQGVVAFTVPRDWEVAGVASKPPVAAAVFAAPDPAAHGGVEASNVVLSIYHLDTEQGRSAVAIIGQAYGAAPEMGHYKAWTTYASEPSHGETRFELIDAAQTFETLKAEVGVRCAWPHLPAHPPGYDARMLDACHAVLDSVAAIPGPYTPASGEVLRRPE